MQAPTDLFTQAAHFFGGVEGDFIDWVHADNAHFHLRHVYRAYGQKAPEALPKVGEKVLCEFIEEWVLFDIVEVNPNSQISGMFFMELTPVDQRPKLKPGRLTSRSPAHLRKYNFITDDK